MKINTYLNISLYLSLAGTLFSGYMSSIKFFTETCAFGETCPYFLGVPACYFGFAMFLTMLIVNLTAIGKNISTLGPVKLVAATSLLGILFSGSFVVQEFFEWSSNTESIRYALGLPTCAYGLLFYITIFVVSVIAYKKVPNKRDELTPNN